jgi:hypothetical protein
VKQKQVLSKPTHRVTFSLWNLIGMVAFVALLLALMVAYRTIAEQRVELNRLKYLVPGGLERIDVECSAETSNGGSWGFTRTLEYPSSHARGFNHSFQSSFDRKVKLGLKVSAWLVGDIELSAGLGKGEQETNGHLVAVQISRFEEAFEKTEIIATEFVVFEGVERMAYDNDGITVMLKPSND